MHTARKIMESWRYCICLFVTCQRYWLNNTSLIIQEWKMKAAQRNCLNHRTADNWYPNAIISGIAIRQTLPLLTTCSDDYAWTREKSVPNVLLCGSSQWCHLVMYSIHVNMFICFKIIANLDSELINFERMKYGNFAMSFCLIVDIEVSC